MKVFVIGILLAMLCFCTANGRTYTREADSLELVKLFNATKGQQWKNNENWLTDKPVGEWFGITTEPVTIGQDQVYVVTKIELGDNNLCVGLPNLAGNLRYFDNDVIITWIWITVGSNLVSQSIFMNRCTDN